MRRILLARAGFALMAWWNKRIAEAETATRSRVRREAEATAKARKLQGHGGRRAA